MYYYLIGGVGFFFDTKRKLVEYSPYDVFRISREEFFTLNERHHYVFLDEKLTLPAKKQLIYSSSSCDVYESGDKYFHINKRFDGEEYKCIVVSQKNTPGGEFYYTNSAQEKLKVTTEFFRCANFVSSLLFFNSMIIHASYIVYNKKAVLFSALSGGGKSTQARLWQNNLGAEIVNGDRAVIKREKEGWFVHSLPMCGSSGICTQKSAKLGAIVMLNKGNDNKIEQLSNAQKLALLLPQITLENKKASDFEKVITNLEGLIKESEIIALTCTPDALAAQALKKYLDGGENA